MENMALRVNYNVLIFFSFFLISGILFPTFCRGAEKPWGPWPKKREIHLHSGEKSGVYQTLFRFYQDNFSSSDGAKCPFYPTCSMYAYQALSKHGLVYGTLLSIDRLFSEYPGMPSSGLYPLITKNGIHRPYDPVP